MLLVPAEEMRTASSHSLLANTNGVFLRLLNRKLIHHSAAQHPVYKILNPTPVIVPIEPQCFGTVGPVNSGFGGVGVSLGTYLGGCRGDGGGTPVDNKASSNASRATRHGVEETWGLGRGLNVVGGVVGVRLDEGGGGGGVSNGGWAEASWLRRLSALESHCGDRGCSPNRSSSGRSSQPHSSSRKEGLEGTKESRRRGLDDMAS